MRKSSFNFFRNGFKVSPLFAKEIGKANALSIREAILPKGQGISEGQILQREPYAEFLEDMAFGGSESELVSGENTCN